MPRRKLIIREEDSDEESDEKTQLQGGKTPKDMVKIYPADNVYSYLMFMLSVDSKKSTKVDHHGWNVFNASCLAAVSMFFQGIILISIFRAVLLEDIDWRNSIMAPEVLPSSGKCNTGSSLCSEINGTFTCSPPSVQLTGRWDELDVNGDGYWSHHEAVKSRDAIICQYAVDPVEVFDVFIKFLLTHEEHIWLHPDLRSGKRIQKAYFTYASGDLIMCGYRNEKQCANLLHRGVFDAPLRYGTAARVGTTIDSALDYCYGLLQKGGTCERTLPSSYSVWKKSSQDQCLGATYEKYVFHHPTNGHTKSLLEVDYNARLAYKMAAHNYLFVIFKGIVIWLFLLAMYSEGKDILLCATFVCRFPSHSQLEREASHSVPPRHAERAESVCSHMSQAWPSIKAISHKTRFITGSIVICRFLMLVVLALVGVTFLQKDTDWVSLLLNGVALVFVLEIASGLFSQVLNEQEQEEFLGANPIDVQNMGISLLNRRPALKDCLCFCMLLSGLAIIMYLQYEIISKPLSAALECACLSQGASCRESTSFSKGFWDKYWRQDVPGVYVDLEKLKRGETISYPIALGHHSGSAEMEQNIWPMVSPEYAAQSDHGNHPHAWKRSGGLHSPEEHGSPWGLHSPATEHSPFNEHLQQQHGESKMLNQNKKLRARHES